jgi:hypothetical protein
VRRSSLVLCSCCLALLGPNSGPLGTLGLQLAISPSLLAARIRFEPSGTLVILIADSPDPVTCRCSRQISLLDQTLGPLPHPIGLGERPAAPPPNPVPQRSWRSPQRGLRHLPHWRARPRRVLGRPAHPRRPPHCWPPCAPGPRPARADPPRSMSHRVSLGGRGIGIAHWVTRRANVLPTPARTWPGRCCSPCWAPSTTMAPVSTGSAHCR